MIEELRQEIIEMLRIPTIDDEWELCAIFLYIDTGREPSASEIQDEIDRRQEEWA